MNEPLQNCRLAPVSQKPQRPIKNAMVFLIGLLFLALMTPVKSFSQSYQQISLSGFNHDLVADGSGGPASTSTSTKMDVQGNVMYVAGYQGCVGYLRFGLPQNRLITSANNNALTYQLQPYNQNNALFLTSGSGTLTFGTSGSYDLITILATSSEGSSNFSATLNFSDGSSSTYSFFVPDWYNGANPAISNFGRVRYASCGTDESDGNPRFYDNVITLTAADKQKLLKSVGFNKSGSGYTSILAITGRTVVNAPATPLNPFANNITSGGFTANWSAVSGATSYKLDISTNSSFSTFVSGYNNANVGNVTAFNVPVTEGTYYFRVRSVNNAGQSLSSSTASAVVPTSCIAPAITNCPQTQYEQIYADATTCSKVFTYSPTISGTNPTVSYTFSGATTASGAGTGSGSAFNVGQTTVTITVTNNCGTSSCTFVVTVVDNVAPIVKTKNITVYLNASGKVTITPQDINDGSSDNCGPVSLSFNSGIVCGIAAENQSTTLTAPAGEKFNSINFASYGTPNGSCGNYTIGGCHASNSISKVSPYLIGLNSGTVPATNGLFGDPCGGTVKRLIIQASYGATSANSFTFNCSNLGVNQVKLLVTDANGQVSSEIATVTVVDNIAPTITGPADISVIATSAAGRPVSYATPAGVDNCSATTIRTSGLASGATFPIGTTVVTHKVTDAAGLSAEYAFNVTVTGVAPVIVCPANIIINNTPGQCGTNVAFAATETTARPAATITYSVASGSFFGIGTKQVTATATNAVGSSSCTFLVTVNDAQLPVIALASPVSVNTDGGVCGANVNLVKPAVSDNCGVASVTNDAPALFSVGTTTVTWTVTDIHGLSASTTQTVTVTDNQAPAFAAIANLSVNTDNDVCGATVTYITPVGTDNCSVATVQTAGLASGSVFPVGTTVNTFVATDASGNATTTSFTVTVTDNQAPAFAAIGNIAVNTDRDVCGATVTYATPIGTDNCDVTTKQLSGLASGSLFPVGTTLNTFEATDASGNVTTISFALTVTDNQAPAFAAIANQSVTTDKDVCGETVTYLTPVGTDNCNVNTVQTAGLPSGSVFPVGTTTNTFVATDASGNTTTISFTVTVTDKQAPYALAKNITVRLVNGSAVITADMVNNGSNDACGIKTLVVSRTSFSCADVDAASTSKNHTVTLTVTDNNGNVSTTTAVVTVIGTKPVPAIAVTRTDNTNTGINTAKTIFLGYGAQSLTLNASNGTSSQANTTYSWSGSNLSSTTVASPVFTPTAAGTYNFTVTATNEFGCSAATQVTVTVIDARCGSGNSGKLDKVIVCHNGNDICISPNAVPAHLAHGCSIGSCTTTVKPNARMVTNIKTVEAVNLVAYPNPVIGKTNIEFNMVQAGTYSLEMYDMKGSLIKVLAKGTSVGNQLVYNELDATSYAEGIYLIKLSTNNQLFTKRISIAK